MPRQIAVIDAETDPFKRGRVPKPFIWGLYDGKDFRTFDNGAVLVEYLYDKRFIVYAHNGGKFDYHFLLEWLTPFDDLTIISGRLAKFRIGDCEFRDSYNILPIPLRDYQKDEIDYAIMEKEVRDKPENRKEVINYLESDCRYLHELVTGFIDEFGCHLTLATGAMKYWQKQSHRKAPKSDELYYNTFKKFYYGGRVECFEGGIIKDNFKMLDINSAYPYAMLHDHPIGLEYDVITDSVEIAARSETIIGQNFYEIECISMGALPFRLTDGSLSFPKDGTLRLYNVTGWELAAALRTATIYDLSIKSIYYHFEYTDFADYINHFYDRRKIAKENDDKKENIFCKLMMNSLYGKFGANPDNYSKFMNLPPEMVSGMEDLKRGQNLEDNYNFSGMLGPWALGEADLEEEDRRYYNAATSASITGFVRAYLWEAINKCGGVMYCDTDSIVCRSHNLNLGGELGEWELEDEFNYGAIAGKKLYAFKRIKENKKETEKASKDEKWKGWYKAASKGVRFNPDQIIEVANGGEVIYEPEAPSFSIHTPPKFINRKIVMRV